MADFKNCSAEDYRQRQEKGEAGGGFAIVAEEQRRGDGDSRAGNSGDKRQALGQTDQDGGFQGYPVQLPSLGAGCIGKSQHQAEDDQKAADQQRTLAEYLLNRLFKSLADNSGRDCADDNVPGETTAGGVQPFAADTAEKVVESCRRCHARSKATGQSASRDGGRHQKSARILPSRAFSG